MSVQEKRFLIHSTDALQAARWLWCWFGSRAGWTSERKWALSFPSREAAEFALLRLEGCEVVER